MRRQTSIPATVLLLFCCALFNIFSAEKDIRKPDWWDDDSIKKEIRKQGAGKDYNETHNIKKAYLPIWGFIRSWQVVGPFDYPDSIGFDASYPPADGYVKGGKYTGKGRKQVTWTEMKPNRDWENHIDLRKNMGNKAIVYAHTYYDSDTGRDTRIWFRARDYITVWVNKVRVYESMDSPQNIDHDYADIKLRKGQNDILIKVSGTGRSHDFWFEVRIADRRFDITETMYYKAMMELFPQMTPQEKEGPCYIMARNLGRLRYIDLAETYYREYRNINKEYKNYANLIREMSPWYTPQDTGPYLRHIELMRELEDEYGKKPDEIAKDVGAYHNLIRHIGNRARDIGEYDIAVEYYKKMISINNNLSSRMADQCTLGLIYCYVADWPEAAKLYKAVKEFYKDEKKFRNVKYPLRDLSRYAGNRKPATQLNENAGISRYILVGEQYVESSEYREAARQFQSTLEKFGSALYKAAPGHYISARDLCRLSILNLGVEGVKAYREIYDEKAGKDFAKAQRAGDKDALLELALAYPVSGFADNALYELGNMFMQEGRLDRASLVFGRLIRDYPDSEIHKRDILMKFAFCLTETGEYGKAKMLLTQLKESGGKEDFVIGGQKFSAWNYTQQELAKLKELDPDPQFGKSIMGMARNSASWSFSFPETEINAVTGKRLEPNPIEPLLYTGKAYKGHAYVQNGRTVFCVSLETGKAVWQRSVPDFLPNWITSDPALGENPYSPLRVMDVNMYNGRIYARLIADHVSSGRSSLEYGLFCIDALTGEMLWGVTDPDGEGGLTFLSDPAVGSGVVCMGAYRQGRSGLGDYYLLGYDSETGDLLWKTHAGSGLTGLRVQDLDVNPLGCGNAMREKDGILYAATGFGSVMAVDVLSGTMIWAREHSRGSIPNFYNSKGDLDMFNIGLIRPIVGEKEVIFAFPDAFGLAVYDKRNGNLIWENHLLKPQYLVGIFINSLYITTPSRVIGLSLFDGNIEWEWFLPAREGWSSAILSETKIYLPTKQGLHVLDPLEKKESAFLPWAENRPAIGNAVFTGEGILGFNGTTMTYYKTESNGKTEKTAAVPASDFKSEPKSFREGDVTVPFMFFHEAYGKKADYAVDDTGRIFILNGNQLYAPDPQNAGEYCWRSYVEPGWKNVNAGNGAVAVSYPRKVEVFNAADGKKRWEKSGITVEQINIHGTVLYIHSYDSYSGVYNLETGEYMCSLNFPRYDRRGGIWPGENTVQYASRYDYRKRNNIGNAVVYEKNILSKGSGFDVVFEPKASEVWMRKSNNMYITVEGGGSSRKICGYDTQSYQKRWEVPMYWRDLSWDVENNYVFTPSWRYDNNQYVIDIKTGKVVYKEKHVSDKGLLFAEDPDNSRIVYEARNGNSIEVSAIDTNTGEKTWKTNVSHGRQWQAFKLLVSGDYVILFRRPYRYTYAGNAMYVLDRSDGSLLQSLEIPGLSMEQASAVGGTVVYRCPEAVFMFRSGNIEERLDEYKAEVCKPETGGAVRRYYSRLVSMYDSKFTYCEPKSALEETEKSDNDLVLDSPEYFMPLADGQTWGGKEDLSCRVRTGWSNAGLQVSVIVRDDSHFNRYSGKSLAMGDCVMIALNNHKDSGPRNHEYVFALSQGQSRFAHVYGGHIYEFPRVKVYYTPDLKDLVYEIMFPWSSMGTDRDHPTEQQDLGFSVSVLDNDKGISEGMMFWGGGQFGGRQPRMFGELFFVPLDSEGIQRYKEAISVVPDWPDSWIFFRRILRNDTSSESDRKAVEYCRWFLETCPQSARVPDVMGLMWMYERYQGNENAEQDVLAFAKKAGVAQERIDEFKKTFISFWIYTDPKAPCRDLLLQLHQRYYRGWEHRMVLGSFGAFYDVRRRRKVTEFQRFGPMPKPGSWHQIRFPAGAIDVLHQELGVLSFYRYDNRMYIDDLRIGDTLLADDEVVKPYYPKGHWTWSEEIKKTGSKSFATEEKRTRSYTNIELWKKPLRIGSQLEADITQENIEPLKKFIATVPGTNEAFETFKKVVDAGVSGVPKGPIPNNVLFPPADSGAEKNDDSKDKKKGRKRGRRNQGLVYEYYELGGNDVGLMKGQKPKKTGTIANFSTKPREREENIGFIFKGQIKISKPGEYKFYTNSDDGTILYIDGKTIVNNDGGHGMQVRSGSIKGMKPGMHPIELWFKQGSGPHGLEVYWESTDFEERISACTEYVRKNPDITNAARVLEYAFRKQYLDLEDVESLMSDVRMPAEVRTRFYISTEPSFRNYAFVGPFTDEGEDEVLNRNERFTDQNVVLTEQYTGKEEAKIKWWRPFDEAVNGQISDNEFRGRKQKYVNGDVIYAWGRVNSPYQRSCTLFTGIQHASITAWLNGDRIMNGRYDHSYEKDEHRTEILLNKGWNTILFKIRITSDWHWAFTTRFGGLFGKSLKDLEYSNEQD